MSELVSFFTDNDPLILLLYGGSVLLVVALGFRAGLRSRHATPRRRTLQGILAGAAASLVHPVHLFVELGSLFDAGLWAATQAVVAFGTIGVIGASLLAIVYRLWPGTHAQ